MNKKLTMYDPIYHAIYKMWIARSIFLGEKIYPNSLCIFISSNGILSIFNMFVMVFIRGAEGGRDQQELTDNFISQI